MKNIIMIVIGLFMIVDYSFSQESKHFNVDKGEQFLDEKNLRFKLSSNHYYHGFDGCDIFVDNLYYNESDNQGINAIFLIEPSLSFFIEKSINGFFSIKRAVIMISLICENDSMASIRINQISLRNKDNTEYEDHNFKNKLEEFVKTIQVRILLKNSNRQSISCGLLFVKKEE